MRLLLTMVGAAALACSPALAQSGKPDPHAGRSVPMWYLGVPVLIGGGPKPPPGTVIPDLPVYITTPVSDTLGHSPEVPEVRPHDGKHVTLPAHQDTLSRLPDPGKPARAVAYFVLPGPKATEDTVESGKQPANSWADGPLVRKIKMGEEWMLLNNHIVIEYGLAKGLLRLQYFDIGGSGMMYKPLDEDIAKFPCDCTVTSPLPALPPLPPGAS